MNDGFPKFPDHIDKQDKDIFERGHLSGVFNNHIGVDGGRVVLGVSTESFNLKYVVYFVI